MLETLQKLRAHRTLEGDRLAAALFRKAQNGAPGSSEARPIALGEGWRVVDIVCTYGPGDQPFEEHFLATSISLVLAGSFIYRSVRGAALMAPGALMLGNCGSAYECSHQHGEGDRCLSFQFQPELFERIARDAGAKRAILDNHCLPPLRELAQLTALASMAALPAVQGPSVRCGLLEEIALELAGRVVSIGCDASTGVKTEHVRDARRIALVLRRMEASSEQCVSIAELADEAGLSPYRFLRAFKRATGITPHQWLLRTRLRHAAERLVACHDAITEIALDVGFDDLSNFIRSFRAEFGVSPRKYRSAKRQKTC
ncbi:MAG: AraC family transcriptional regulator [Deltaproteobacteria bacterium]|nr:AraC family transcriptional regulator [Deltaproteobacteria bacterium]